MASSSSRDEILRRIGEALCSRGEHGIAVKDEHDRGSAKRAGPETESSESLVRRFERELVAVGGCFHKASNSFEVGDRILQIVEARNARKVIAWSALRAVNPELTRRLNQAGVELIAACSDLRTVAAADVGITTVDYALADTGTLVLRSGEQKPRSTSLLPPVHIALVDPKQIVSGLDELFGRLSLDGNPGGRLDSAITFITGPSRTADIELTLVVGVHGPQELHVIMLNQGAWREDGG
jgi:L-lactate dehydrogenase complex protein LldG